MTSPAEQIRQTVLRLDGFTCRWCCSPAEHVVRVNPAGPPVPSNLISLCRGCRPVHAYHLSAAPHDAHFRRGLAKPVDRTPVTQGGESRLTPHA